jgi:thiosulfate/3-mercaptopyruvate sulfurtransferase
MRRGFQTPTAPARWIGLLPAVILVGLAAAAAFSGVTRAPRADSDPWSASQTVDPPALLKEMAAKDAASRPVVVCVGFHSLYHGAHIPGASYHGPGSTPEGLADLKKFAQTLPRSTNLVIYCGCCPLEHCPNIRPAFVALRDAGFTHLRVLILPHDFASDWVVKGYPVSRGD